MRRLQGGLVRRQTRGISGLTPLHPATVVDMLAFAGTVQWRSPGLWRHAGLSQTMLPRSTPRITTRHLTSGGIGRGVGCPMALR